VCPEYPSDANKEASICFAWRRAVTYLCTRSKLELTCLHGRSKGRPPEPPILPGLEALHMIVVHNLTMQTSNIFLRGEQVVSIPSPPSIPSQEAPVPVLRYSVFPRVLPGEVCLLRRHCSTPSWWIIWRAFGYQELP
jgi:hypothetical protein